MNDQAWVERRLGLLEPAEAATPDVSGAFAKLRERDRRYRVVRRNWIWGCAVATVALLVLVAVPTKSVCCARPEAAPTEPVAAPAIPHEAPPRQPVRPSKPVPPPVPAPLVCEIYSDFECPACAAFYRETFPQFEAEYVKTGKVKLVHRDFPLPQHRFAMPAARYAEAARELGVYDAVAHRLYETQAEWGANGNIEGSLRDVVAPETLAKMKDLAEGDTKIDIAIGRDRLQGGSDGVNQTPSLVIVTPDGLRHKLAGAVPFVTLSAYLDELMRVR